MDLSILPKDEIWLLRMCHHFSNAVYQCYFHPKDEGIKFLQDIHRKYILHVRIRICRWHFNLKKIYWVLERNAYWGASWFVLFTRYFRAVNLAMIWLDHVVCIKNSCLKPQQKKRSIWRLDINWRLKNRSLRNWQYKLTCCNASTWRRTKSSAVTKHN